jgi:excisionase family DNA binding protein
MGRVEIRERPGASAGEVLDLQEVADLLRLPTDSIEQLARDGELPGRRVGSEWRFARSAVLGWLSPETVVRESSAGQDAG